MLQNGDYNKSNKRTKKLQFALQFFARSIYSETNSLPRLSPGQDKSHCMTSQIRKKSNSLEHKNQAYNHHGDTANPSYSGQADPLPEKVG